MKSFSLLLPVAVLASWVISPAAASAAQPPAGIYAVQQRYLLGGSGGWDQRNSRNCGNGEWAKISLRKRRAALMVRGG